MTDPVLLQGALQSAADAWAAILRETRPEHTWIVTVRPAPPAASPVEDESESPPGSASVTHPAGVKPDTPRGA